MPVDRIQINKHFPEYGNSKDGDNETIKFLMKDPCMNYYLRI